MLLVPLLMSQQIFNMVILYLHVLNFWIIVVIILVLEASLRWPNGLTCQCLLNYNAQEVGIRGRSAEHAIFVPGVDCK